MSRKVTFLPYKGTSLPAGVPPDATAVAIEGIVQTSGILGVDPRTGLLPPEPERQFELAFRNLEQLVGLAGLSTDEVGLVTVYIPGPDYRQYINPAWLATFPQEDDRPARKTNHVKLPEGVYVELQAAAVAGQRRQRLEIPGLSHRDPLPMGCRLGDLVFSSVISPQDPADGRNVPDRLAQIDRCFANSRLLMEQAGGSLADVAHMWVFMSDFEFQPAMVEAWVRTWPTDGDRPSRKTLRYALGGETLMQVQLTGVLNGRRSNHEIPGVHHHDPIPMGTKIGRIFHSSGVSPSDPRGDGLAPVAGGLEPQILQCQENVQALMNAAGGSLDDILLVTILIDDIATIPVVRRHWDRLFPDGSNQPALKFIDWGTRGGSKVQYHVTAIIN